MTFLWPAGAPAPIDPSTKANMVSKPDRHFRAWIAEPLQYTNVSEVEAVEEDEYQFAGVSIGSETDKNGKSTYSGDGAMVSVRQYGQTNAFPET